MEGAKSVILFHINYFPKKKLKELRILKFKYAYGEDYHEVIKEILRDMVEELQQEIGEFVFVFVDSAASFRKSLG